ncbi:DUF4365 domain-containing protein [Fuchsiella alkaliacetigena]|uniref:DUF4365 domain-containing protein n=1 Tax=Fuchsiella alkaliacetigena TaxID=957042 RepID=UPI00200B8946|nr:DUF4365 domain-containing protein [Fuchsiella alkaliacetigena]MCK8825392.1 DUF4365 domain-containing protein [Fuchsiella alkaliacetigena]
MSLLDNLETDEDSIVAEEAIKALDSLFTKENGFILREESVASKGVFEVGLLIDNLPTDKSFFIQLESSAEISTIEKKGSKYIFYPFKIARLRCFARQGPEYGLIIIYDQNSESFYFDYVENIINRITRQRDSKEWQDLQRVNINLPVENTLTSEKMSDIYNVYLNRFKNQDTLLMEPGRKHGISLLKFVNQELAEQAEMLELNSFDKLIEAFKRYGFGLFNERDYQLLDRLLSRLSFAKINNSQEFSLLAALVYIKTGEYIKAKYYLKRSKEFRENYELAEAVELLNFLSSKIEFILGDLDRQSYLNKLAKLIVRLNYLTNKFSIKLEMIYLQMFSTIKSRGDILAIVKEIETLLAEIKAANIEERVKHFLLLTTSINLYKLGVFLFERNIVNGNSEGKPDFMSLKEQISFAKEIITLLDIPLKYSKIAYNYSVREDDELLYAYSLYQLALFFFKLEFNNAMLIDREAESTQKLENKYQRYFEAATQVYNIFLANSLLKEGHEAITLAYELKKLYKYKMAEGAEEFNFDNFEQKIRMLEREVGIRAFSSSIEQFYQETIPKLRISGEPAFVDLEETEIDNFADYFLESFGLSKVNKKNLLKDIENCQLFTQEIDNPQIELLQKMEAKGSEAKLYDKPLSYILRCQECGYKTSEASQVESLIEELRREHDSDCS